MELKEGFLSGLHLGILLAEVLVEFPQGLFIGSPSSDHEPHHVTDAVLAVLKGG